MSYQGRTTQDPIILTLHPVCPPLQSHLCWSKKLHQFLKKNNNMMCQQMTNTS